MVEQYVMGKTDPIAVWKQNTNLDEIVGRFVRKINPAHDQSPPDNHRRDSFGYGPLQAT
jgi:hypothetical protein